MDLKKNRCSDNYIMSQKHDESFNSIGSEEIDDKRCVPNNAFVSGSGSSSESESDSEASSSSSVSSGRSSPDHDEESHRNANAGDAQINEHQRQHKRHHHHHHRNGEKQKLQYNTKNEENSTATETVVAGLPPATPADTDPAKDDSKTNGYSDDNESDDSDTHSESNSESGDELDNGQHVIAAGEDGHASSALANTSNTTNDDEELDEDESPDDLSIRDPESENDDNNKSANEVDTMTRAQTTQIANANTMKSFENDDNDEDGDGEDDSVESEKSSASTAESPTASSSTSSEDDEDDYQPKRSRRNVRKPPAEKVKKPVKKKKKKQNWDSDESDESDEESEDTTAPSKRKPPPKNNNTKTQNQRRKKTTNYSTDESGEDSKRFGTRRTAAAVSYKETSDIEKTDSEDLLEVEYDESQAVAAEEEEKCETIERILAKRNGKKGCTGNQTTIYAIEDQGQDPNEGVDENDLNNTEVQYLIKWKGWSYIHNTWESEATLREQKVKGMKKLDNFIKKEQDVTYWRKYAGPEDIDYFECQMELQNDLLKSYNNVDRIIARNEKPDGNCEYLCKWESLPYSEATWEDAALVTRKWQRCVDQYEERELSKCTPSRHCKVLKYRPKFYKIKGHPEFLINDALTLRDYQMDGLNWLLHSWCKENSVILADEMGLGKTIQTICFLYSLFKVHHLYGPFLCVVPLSTMTAWQREFDLWGPDMNVVTYLGDVKSREMIRQYEWQFDGSKRLKFNCILTTYEIVLKDKLFLGTLQWAALLVDEAHRLKNDDSLLYKSLKEFDTNHRLLITGTPLQNSLKELWALLHFIMPEKFVTWEDFEKEHGNAADKGYTKLHQQLEPYILRRVKKDVEKSLPAKVEQILRVEMTSLQKQYYKWILTKNFDALRKGKKGSTSTFLNIVIELKKCCNHAALIRPSEFELIGLNQDEALQTLLKGSGKLVLLDKLLCRLKETGHRVLIFSQMVRMLDILADYLQKRHFPFQRLDGSIKGEMRRQALDHYNAEGSQDFCFLLSTRAGGLGINLATADTVIIFDSDWNPQNDLQAQARAHRIGQKNQVNIYRLVTARSVEEQIVERAKQKMVLDHLVIQRMDTTGRTVLDKSGSGNSTNSTPFNKDDLSAILKFGAEELFKDEQEHDDELVCDIDEILRRAETRNEDPEMPGDDLLSAFKVASIAAFEEDATSGGDGGTGPSTTKDEHGDEDDTKDWDDIIPEDYRQIVENQERAKEMEDLYLPPRRKTTASNNQADRKQKKAQSNADDSGADSDYDCGSDASGDGDGRPKKRGRPAVKEKITGFTDAEIRRFIKSYKKFPAPLMRLEAIACDAELQEKPMMELKRIGEMLHDRCVQFLEEHKDDAKSCSAAASEESSKQKRSRATYSVKLGGVSFNAKTLLTCEEELQPLNEIIPSVATERLQWALDIKTRPANFDVDWGVDEDSKLLCGIYQYGIGSWEQMKLDPSLRLTEKILFNDARKPQAKHLQSRAEYLLKIIKKNVELKKGRIQKKQRKPRKVKDTKMSGPAMASSINATPENRSRHISENHGEDGSQMGNSAGGDFGADGVRHERRPRNRDSVSKGDGTNDEATHDTSTDAQSLTASAKKRFKRKSAAIDRKTKKLSSSATGSGTTNKPMHFTANNEPRALEVLGDLDPNIFNECKEKMRPVKKALKALDRPDSSLSNQDQVRHTRECLISIGKQIDICLEAYKEPEKKEWRSNLWYFVSKFTEFDAKKLFKLYKNTLKMSEGGGEGNSEEKGLSQSPVKRPPQQLENSHNGMAALDHDKSAKKKKKDKDKDRDRDRHRYNDPDKSKPRMFSGGNECSPVKRKRDENDVAGDGKSLTPYKRMHADGSGSSRNRDRSDERKKHHHRDDYYCSGGKSHDNSNRGDRRNSMNSPSTPCNNRGMQHGMGGNRLAAGCMSSSGNYSQLSGADGRTNSPYIDGGDRWGHRDRYGPSDYKRDRYDSYNSRGNAGNSGYHRDHRDRDRDRRPDKRRYPPSHPPPLNYPGHYMPPGYFMGNGVLPPAPVPPPHGVVYRGDPRYAGAGGDWPRDSRMDYPISDFRRGEYDRRSQP